MSTPDTGWPSGRPRVLVTDAWLANAGDAAIAHALEELIRSVAPDAAVVHAAYQANLVGDRLGLSDLAPPLDSLLDVVGADALPEPWTSRAATALVQDADLVVSQGGGFLLEHYQPWQRLLAHAAVVELGRPLAYLGQTIGRFAAARARALLRRTLSAARVVSVRDRASLDHVVEMGADPRRVLLTSDLTFTLFPPPPEPGPSDTSGVAVVLTAHEHADGDIDRRASSARLLTAVIDRARDRETISLLSTTQGLGGYGIEDDSSLALEILSALDLQTRARVDVVEGYLTPREVVARLTRVRAVVSQRFHPAVFALASGVPAALISDASKATVLAGLGLDAALCNEPTSDRAVGTALDAVLAPDAPSGRSLWEMLAPARELAERNRAVLAQLLDGAG